MGQATRERSEIPDRFKWNTSHLYPSDAAWERQRRRLVRTFVKIAAMRGKLRSAAGALECLQQTFDARRQLSRLANYANRRHDEDTRVAKYQAMKDVIEKVAVELSTTTAFIEPELLALPSARLRAMAKDRRFAHFDRYLRELLRQKKHVLSPAEEALLARTSLMHDAGHNAYATFSAADLRFPPIRDRKGRQIELTQALFSRLRAAPRRKLRKAAFDTFFGTYAGYRNTLAALLSAQVNANLVQAQARRYRDALEAALDPDDIPTAVYHGLIKAANAHLPKLHRYLELRRRLLGLKKLRYYDLYVPMVDKARFKVSYERGCALLVEAMAPMGPDYVEALSNGLAPQSGWVDPFPNAGKRSGAYMEGSAYDVHPYVLGNYLDDYNSLGMIAHEMGHAIHSHLSNRHQPYPKADYSIFVAEVASTLNEALLAEHLTHRLKGKKKRFLLGEQLESFRQTFFRQALFAEFELEIYRLAQKNEALTADRLTALYLEIARRYYGHDEGVVEIDEAYGVEWAYIPHFYYNFYVFQYATGITAATALCQLIIRDGAPARRRYVEGLLKAGCSSSPIAILKRAGVDLTSAKPYGLAMRAFDQTIDRLEALCA